MTDLQNKLLAAAIMQCWHYSENDLIINTEDGSHFTTFEILRMPDLPNYVYEAGIEKLKGMEIDPVRIDEALFKLLTKGCEFPKIHRTPHVNTSVYKNHGLIIEKIDLCNEIDFTYIISTDREL